MAKEPAPQQLRFSIEGGKIGMPGHLSDLNYGRYIIEQLGRNPLFKEKPPQGWALVVDLTSEQPKRQIYNPDNWQTVDKKPENLINPNHALIIFAVDGLFSLSELQQQLQELKTQLNQNGGEIFIFENGLQLNKEELEKIRKERADIFEALGFIKFKLFSSKKLKKEEPITGLITQARLKKIGEHHRIEVDLLTPRESDSPKKAAWRENIISNIITLYRELGFTEIDVSEIEECLRHSTYPPRDLQRARDGWGVEAKATCGCHIRVDLEGNFFILDHCSQHEKGIPNPDVAIEKQKKIYRPGETELEITCGDCGARLIQSVRVIKNYRNGKTSALVELRCPSCGVIRVERVYAPTKCFIN